MILTTFSTLSRAFRFRLGHNFYAFSMLSLLLPALQFLCEKNLLSVYTLDLYCCVLVYRPCFISALYQMGECVNVCYGIRLTS
jgi:hypothetical protein